VLWIYYADSRFLVSLTKLPSIERKPGFIVIETFHFQLDRTRETTRRHPQTPDSCIHPPVQLLSQPLPDSVTEIVG